MEHDDAFIANLLCPISRERIDIPVIAEDGFTYDKASMDYWLSSSIISPMMGCPLASKKIFHNRNLDYLFGRYDFYASQTIHFKYKRNENNIITIKPLSEPLKLQINSLIKAYFQLIYPLNIFYKRLESLIAQYPKVIQLYLEYSNIKRFGGDLEMSLNLIHDNLASYPRSKEDRSKLFNC